ncbi:MAG: M48 family metalloprotease [Pseudomonadota bacterium]
MQRSLYVGVLLLLAACAQNSNVPVPTSTTVQIERTSGEPRSQGDFSRVARRVEPVAETFCREEAPSAGRSYCDFQILLDTSPSSPPNAFQTLSRDGRPVLVLTSALLEEMRSDDEIALVLSHEAAHHVAQHLPKLQQSQAFGALIAGGIATALGGDAVTDDAIRDAMDLGAFVGVRTYSQQFEFEADWIGAFIAARAGYDPENGAQIFLRPSLQSGGGPTLLSTHPASPQRTALVSQAAREISQQQNAGLTPRP